MDYELALKLKEAGFPQKPFGTCCPCIENTIERDGTWICGHSRDAFITIPSLSELIEACGKDLHNLHHYNGSHDTVWVTNFQTDKITMQWDSEGNTPEIAVANLWLALNKKD